MWLRNTIGAMYKANQDFIDHALGIQ